MGYVDDLKFAHAASLTADITLFNRPAFFAGVQDVDEARGTVSLHAPLTFKDSPTQRFPLTEISSVAVTPINWHLPNTIG